MNTNESRTLWLSIIFAFGAMLLIYSWSQDKQTEVHRKMGATKKVVRASEDISEMETIDESKLEVADVPGDFIQPEAINDINIAVGQVAAAPIRKGEQVLQTKLLLPGPETGLSLEVSAGKRAINIPIDDMRGVSHLLKPGDRIDLIAAIDTGKGQESHREVRVIMQDVPILATGLNIVNNLPRRFESDADGKKITRFNLSGNTNFSNITVEAKPDEAQTLIYILSTSPGSLFVTLRNPTDRIINLAKSIGVEDVLGRARLFIPSAPPSANIVSPPPLQQPMPASVPRRLPAPTNKRRKGNFQEF
jgi:pilus assembly protein CpaB